MLVYSLERIDIEVVSFRFGFGKFGKKFCFFVLSKIFATLELRIPRGERLRIEEIKALKGT